MEEMNNQEMMMEVQEMAKQTEQIEQHCQFLDNQIEELQNFKNNLDSFDTKTGGKMLSSFGKGVFMETELKSEKLLVEVGAGILIKKERKEVSDILTNQIKALKDSRVYFGEQYDSYTEQLQKRMQILESMMEKKVK